MCLIFLNNKMAYPLDIYRLSIYNNYIDDLYNERMLSMEQSPITGNTEMLILKLLQEQDMYGYQMIEELSRRSNKTFELKAGTLYPLLHLLEQKHYLESYNGQSTAGKPRKYYRITKKGNTQLQIRQKEWATYHTAINQVLAGGEKGDI